MRRSANWTAVIAVAPLALLGVTIIGLAVPGSLTGGRSLACWAALLCGLLVRSLFVLIPGQRGRLGEVNRQLVPVPVVGFLLAGRGSCSIR